jgi:hypothetical protein
MIKTVLLPLALLAAAPALAQAPSVADHAAQMQDLVGRRFEAGLTISAIRAERATLVVVLDGPAGWRRTLSDVQITRLLLRGFCESATYDFFTDGKTMRVDSLEGGRRLRRGPVQRSCG